MLVPMGELLAAAKRDGYAIGSFDIVNLETCRAVLDSAVALKSPVIIAVPEHFGALCGFENLVAGIRMLAQTLPVPVAPILDHGRTYESCMRALRAGMTGVMFDGSRLPLPENIAIMREVARVAHAMGVSVEGEVGHVGRGLVAAEDAADESVFTSPEEAVKFVEATGVDALAVAVGTSHGVYKGEPHIDFALLRRIDAAAGVPLVLHGGSSTGDERLRRAVVDGVRKVNIFTDMSLQGAENMREIMAREGDGAGVLSLLTAAREGFRTVSAHYMRLFGSAGKA
ncbi:MAG: class II fructose-bisphosphate aldolase [Chloroflexota bacterium]